MPKRYSSLHQFYLYFALALILTSCDSSEDEDRTVYIVYMGGMPPHPVHIQSSHHLSILQQVVSSSIIQNLLVRSYKRSFNGFAALLTENEKERLAGMDGVVSVFPDVEYQLHTTRSWDFLGMARTVKRNLSLESDTIIGVLDSGIWPESESFNDDGLGPPPAKWKGACKGGTNFTCNNKLIGARYYGVESARDEDGHGTHTASTAAGSGVEGASLFGLAEGYARGGVPSARIAAYRVCSPGGCRSESILAAFDDAIADGVDIISVSLGGSSATPFAEDPIAIGAFHAMERGILTVNSAGNAGPAEGNIASVAPWMLTVAASSTDRHFADKVVLGDHRTIMGSSLNHFDLGRNMYPLVLGRNATRTCRERDAEWCFPGCLEPELVKGKIVLCRMYEGKSEAMAAGAIGAITTAPFLADAPFVEPLPLATLGSDDYDKVETYVASTKKPKGTILRSEVTEDPKAPQVVFFSSRGPNRIAPEILKPDLTAPGLNILAAFSPLAPPSGRNKNSDTRRVKYNIMSGTSMACPHVAGIAAYVKTMHPDWSPSVIHSALMTSASPMNATDRYENDFAYGSGHVNPLQAVDPGLVYEASRADYIKMLCGLNYTERMIEAISGDKVTCPTAFDASVVRNLNYPSLAAPVPGDKPIDVTFTRTVTNIGSSNSTYKVRVIAEDNLKISVVPEILDFEALNEKKSFTVTVTGELASRRASYLIWSDGKHRVRSPIFVYVSSILR